MGLSPFLLNLTFTYENSRFKERQFTQTCRHFFRNNTSENFWQKAWCKNRSDHTFPNKIFAIHFTWNYFTLFFFQFAFLSSAGASEILLNILGIILVRTFDRRHDAKIGQIILFQTKYLRYISHEIILPCFFSNLHFCLLQVHLRSY